MKIGVIVHSRTGNTLSVADRLRDALSARGHTTSAERVTAVNEEPKAGERPVLDAAPDTAGYDALVFAAPVHGFSLSPVMEMYLSGLSQLEGKKTAFFVTQHFPKPWLGGNRAVKQMKELCAGKGASFSAAGVVNWSSKHRERQIEALIEDICGAFSE